MSLNSGIAPSLRGKPGSANFSISNRPDRGRGIVYSIQWGFNIGNRYATTGEYVGLTSQSAKERFFTHMQAAGKYGYNYADVDGKRRSVISKSSSKTDGDKDPPRLFYTAMRTAMGPSKKNLDPMKAYRFVTTIAHVNLFDLAVTERAAIKARKTFDTRFSGKSYTDIINDFGIKSGGGQKLGFNSSPGFGEGSKIKTRRDLKRVDLVAAAAEFIKDGRGSGATPYNLGSLRTEIGIKGADLVEDILNTLKFFSGRLKGAKPEDIDKLGPNTEKLVRNAGRTQIEEELNKLGIKYSKLGKVDIGEKARALNIMINHSGSQSKSGLSVNRQVMKGIVNFFDSPAFSQSTNAQVLVTVLGTNKRSITKAKPALQKLITEDLKYVFIDNALYAIQTNIRKIKGNENFTLDKSAFEKAKKVGIENFVRNMLDEPFFKSVDPEELKKQRTKSMKKYGLDFKDYETSLK